MELQDYTPIFDVEKKFRGVNNIRTPEVSYRAIFWGGGALVVSSAVYWFLLRPVIGLLPLPTPALIIMGAALVLLPAIIFGKAATSKMAHGKELIDLVSSWATYRFSSQQYSDFRPWKSAEKTVHIETVIADSEKRSSH